MKCFQSRMIVLNNAWRSVCKRANSHFNNIIKQTEKRKQLTNLTCSPSLACREFQFKTHRPTQLGRERSPRLAPSRVVVFNVARACVSFASQVRRRMAPSVGWTAVRRSRGCTTFTGRWPRRRLPTIRRRPRPVCWSGCTGPGPVAVAGRRRRRWTAFCRPCWTPCSRRATNRPTAAPGPAHRPPSCSSARPGRSRRSWPRPVRGSRTAWTDP